MWLHCLPFKLICLHTYFRMGGIFVLNAKSRKTQNLPPRENFHLYSNYCMFYGQSPVLNHSFCIGAGESYLAVRDTIIIELRNTGKVQHALYNTQSLIIALYSCTSGSPRHLTSLFVLVLVKTDCDGCQRHRITWKYRKRTACTDSTQSL